MDLQFPSIPVLSAFLLLLFMVLKNAKRTQNSNSKLPPGPWKLPLIGNLHNMLGPLPHHTLRNLAKKYGPLMHLQLGEVSAVVVSSPKVAEQIMKTHDLIFADRPEILAAKIISYNCTSIAFSPYGDYWRHVRKISVLELLNAKQVRLFRSLREEEVSKMIKGISLKAGLPVNLGQIISNSSNDITSRAAFGNKYKDKEVLISIVQESGTLAGGFGLEDLFPSLKFIHFISGTKSKLGRMHQMIDKFLDGIIEDHRRRNKKDDDNGYSEKDFVDVLLQVQESGEFSLTTENVKAVIWDIFAAGTDTSSNTIQWAISEILKNRRVMKMVQAEVRQVLHGQKQIDETNIHKLDYLKLVIKETLRLHPPAPLLIPRESRERCKINGYEIPAKTKVIVNAGAIGRDPEYWSNAEIFEPERFDGSSVEYKGTNFEFIPFGAGRRMCPGISFGAASMELILAQLLYHFDWKLTKEEKPEDLDMTECFGATVARKNDLILIPIPYAPSCPCCL